jgi:acetyl/propionyl-CoA carboxylase alpha subunit
LPLRREDAGLTFIGPRPRHRLMGSKTAARARPRAAGVPIVPGTDAPLGPSERRRARGRGRRVGYPIMVKAVAGGGGKGMRVVARAERSAGAVRARRSEAGSSFGDSAIYFERR